MRITSLTLGGFKGLRDTANIPLAPITLLFGANSTGKSTILHGLLYLYEIIVNNNIDPQYSQLTGNKVWLGGFRNIMHGKNDEGVITLGATLEMNNDTQLLDNYLSNAEEYLLDQELGYFPDSGSDRWGFRLEIAWDAIENRPYIQRYECYGNGELFCRFDKRSGTPENSCHTRFGRRSSTDIPKKCSSAFPSYRRQKKPEMSHLMIFAILWLLSWIVMLDLRLIK